MGLGAGHLAPDLGHSATPAPSPQLAAPRVLRTHVEKAI